MWTDVPENIASINGLKQHIQRWDIQVSNSGGIRTKLKTDKEWMYWDSWFTAKLYIKSE